MISVEKSDNRDHESGSSQERKVPRSSAYHDDEIASKNSKSNEKARFR